MNDTNKKIRVLHIIGNLRFGGAQVVVKQIVENSNPDLFQHYVYSLRPEPNDMSIDGKIIEHRRFRYDIRKFFDLIKICREKKIDIVHAHLQKSILGGLLLTYFHKVPVIIHEHGPISRPGISNSAYRFLLSYLYSRSTEIIANSDAISKALHRHSKIPCEKIRIVPNAVDLCRFQYDPETRIHLRQKYRLRDEEIALGFIGRLHPVKGVDCLVESMKTLVKHNPLFRLFVVGNGPLEKTLIQKDNPKISQS